METLNKLLLRLLSENRIENGDTAFFNLLEEACAECQISFKRNELSANAHLTLRWEVHEKINHYILGSIIRTPGIVIAGESVLEPEIVVRCNASSPLLETLYNSPSEVIQGLLRDSLLWTSIPADNTTLKDEIFKRIVSHCAFLQDQRETMDFDVEKQALREFWIVQAFPVELIEHSLFADVAFEQKADNADSEKMPISSQEIDLSPLSTDRLSQFSELPDYLIALQTRSEELANDTLIINQCNIDFYLNEVLSEKNIQADSFLLAIESLQFTQASHIGKIEEPVLLAKGVVQFHSNSNQWQVLLAPRICLVRMQSILSGFYNQNNALLPKHLKIHSINQQDAESALLHFRDTQLFDFEILQELLEHICSHEDETLLQAFLADTALLEFYKRQANYIGQMPPEVIPGVLELNALKELMQSDAQAQYQINTVQGEKHAVISSSPGLKLNGILRMSGKITLGMPLLPSGLQYSDPQMWQLITDVFTFKEHFNDAVLNQLSAGLDKLRNANLLDLYREMCALLVQLFPDFTLIDEQDAFSQLQQNPQLRLIVKDKHSDELIGEPFIYGLCWRNKEVLPPSGTLVRVAHPLEEWINENAYDMAVISARRVFDQVPGDNQRLTQEHIAEILKLIANDAKSLPYELIADIIKDTQVRRISVSDNLATAESCQWPDVQWLIDSTEESGTVLEVSCDVYVVASLFNGKTNVSQWLTSGEITLSCGRDYSSEFREVFSNFAQVINTSGFLAELDAISPGELFQTEFIQLLDSFLAQLNTLQSRNPWSIEFFSPLVECDLLSLQPFDDAESEIVYELRDTPDTQVIEPAVVISLNGRADRFPEFAYYFHGKQIQSVQLPVQIAEIVNVLQLRLGSIDDESALPDSVRRSLIQQIEDCEKELFAEEFRLNLIDETSFNSESLKHNFNKFESCFKKLMSQYQLFKTNTSLLTALNEFCNINMTYTETKGRRDNLWDFACPALYEESSSILEIHRVSLAPFISSVSQPVTGVDALLFPTVANSDELIAFITRRILHVVNFLQFQLSVYLKQNIDDLDEDTENPNDPIHHFLNFYLEHSDSDEDNLKPYVAARFSSGQVLKRFHQNVYQEIEADIKDAYEDNNEVMAVGLKRMLEFIEELLYNHLSTRDDISIKLDKGIKKGDKITSELLHSIELEDERSITLGDINNQHIEIDDVLATGINISVGDNSGQVLNTVVKIDESLLTQFY